MRRVTAPNGELIGAREPVVQHQCAILRHVGDALAGVPTANRRWQRVGPDGGHR